MRIISKSAGALSYLNATIGRPNFGVEINGRAALERRLRNVDDIAIADVKGLGIFPF